MYCGHERFRTAARIEYLHRTRRRYRALFPIADDDSVWNILVHLVKSHLRGDLVTIQPEAVLLTPRGLNTYR